MPILFTPFDHILLAKKDINKPVINDDGFILLLDYRELELYQQNNHGFLVFSVKSQHTIYKIIIVPEINRPIHSLNMTLTNLAFSP